MDPSDWWQRWMAFLRWSWLIFIVHSEGQAQACCTLLVPAVFRMSYSVTAPPVVLTIQRVKEVGKEKRVSLRVLCSVPLVWFGSGLVLHGVLRLCVLVLTHSSPSPFVFQSGRQSLDNQ